MSKKTNPIALRVGIRRSWPMAFHQLSSDSALLCKTLKLEKLLSKLLPGIGSFGISKSIKVFDSNVLLFLSTIRRFSLLLPSSILKNSSISGSKVSLHRKRVMLSSISSSSLGFVFIARFRLKNFLLRQVPISFGGSRQSVHRKLSHIQCNALTIRRKSSFSLSINQSLVYEKKWLFSQFLSAQIVADYIALQLTLAPNLKDSNFRKSLKLGVFETFNSILSLNKQDNISGIKLICSGRWQKVRSNRKQRFIYRLGQFKTTKSMSYLDFGNALFHSKNGSTCIKIWILYGPTKL